MVKRMMVMGLMALSVLLIAVVGRDRSLTMVFGPIEVKTTDFANLVLGPKPNQFLVCPASYCAATPHMISPAFPISAERLRQRWITMIAAQPRIESGSSDNQNLQYDYIQRSALIRYPDSITVRFIPLDNDHATLAIYSRSHYGTSDLGVNENRIRSWLKFLEEG